MQTCHPCLMNLELKIHIFTHIHALSTMQDVCTQASPLQPAYIEICAKKYKNGVRFPCHNKRSLILGLPYTENVSTRPFNCILKAIKSQFQAMEKRKKHSTLRAKLLWRNYFILSMHPFCPSSLNIVFSPPSSSVLLREPHCLFPLSLPLVED
jgi:hypothetical protein